jgi:serine/threonine protein kinase
VIKKSKYGFHGLLKQEIAALSGVHHPHNMHLVCCVQEEKSCSYVMERMNKSLFKLLESNQLSLIRRVDIMLQIAEGIHFLHSMGLVHRDLKPHNILMKCDGGGFESSTSAPVGEPLWIAKVCDFGTTKAKMESTAFSHQTIPIGTLMFMAPEAYALEDGDEEPKRFHPMKTDVYSFGLICHSVLIWEPTPFPAEELWNPSVRGFKARVRKGHRPQLPTDCPFRLSTLIKQCWDVNPLMRPNFQNICQELRYIKGLLLAGMVFHHCTHSTITLIQY